MADDSLSTQDWPDRVDAGMLIKRYKEKFQDLQPDPDGVYAGSMWHIIALSHQILGNLDAMLRGEEEELSAADMFVMCVLFIAADRKLRPSDIARVLSVTQAAISLRVAKLESRGLVSRAGDSEDRRTVRLSLAPKAVDMVRRFLADVSVNSGFARSLAKLEAEDRAQLGSLLERLSTEMARHVVQP
nr:MarR family transcriptional regulator [Sphingomonas sp. Y57]